MLWLSLIQRGRLQWGWFGLKCRFDLADLLEKLSINTWREKQHEELFEMLPCHPYTVNSFYYIIKSMNHVLTNWLLIYERAGRLFKSSRNSFNDVGVDISLHASIFIDRIYINDRHVLIESFSSNLAMRQPIQNDTSTQISIIEAYLIESTKARPLADLTLCT